jgi:hypothetical protein
MVHRQKPCRRSLPLLGVALVVAGAELLRMWKKRRLAAFTAEGQCWLKLTVRSVFVANVCKPPSTSVLQQLRAGTEYLERLSAPPAWLPPKFRSGNLRCARGCQGNVTQAGNPTLRRGAAGRRERSTPRRARRRARCSTPGIRDRMDAGFGHLSGSHERNGQTTALRHTGHSPWEWRARSRRGRSGFPAQSGHSCIAQRRSAIGGWIRAASHARPGQGLGNCPAPDQASRTSFSRIVRSRMAMVP